MEAPANRVLRIFILEIARLRISSASCERNNADKRSHRCYNEATYPMVCGVRVRVALQLRSVLALGQRRYFQLRMRRSLVSIVQFNGLQREIRSALWRNSGNNGTEHRHHCRVWSPWYCFLGRLTIGRSSRRSCKSTGPNIDPRGTRCY